MRQCASYLWILCLRHPDKSISKWKSLPFDHGKLCDQPHVYVSNEAEVHVSSVTRLNRMLIGTSLSSFNALLPRFSYYLCLSTVHLNPTWLPLGHALTQGQK